METVIYRQEKNSSGVTMIFNLAKVSWMYPDNIIRVKQLREQSTSNLLQHDWHDKMVCGCTVGGYKQLILGGQTGVITVYRLSYSQTKGEVAVCGQPVRLYGHDSRITAVYACEQFSVVVTADSSGVCIVWDTNRLSYAHSYRAHHGVVRAVSVSSTLGYIASVSHTGLLSHLAVHNINSKHVGSIDTELAINCICFSTSPEGTAINIIAAGIEDGSIRMWNTWDLQLVRAISSPASSLPLISLIFSKDSHTLYASNTDGRVFVWHRAGRTKDHPESNFMPLM
ncbi:PREDICTED: lysosomal-trafficking regulator-like isoform X2 [Priapulus caudatus]|uniref:Lysosomal-trafficking regulator-like isoform X2 n=1 Tax=Priapulus caudatus TaxID=37621 RepID=A0ABM1DQ43_PRICU|nr:PREDICTED: lysosomal-trafficking regulator-like isoform X2 [Priapulus caudatus]